ncbi:RNA polymerase sigma factor [Mesorhizobium sp. M1C.F.Ca.ET.193.01.1.1]|uniref:RNA polymerase sigma factor n=1 Tax=unclassified Mesorhizobium TaxID=325217 RepID=UPI000FD5F9B9|nr:MULTISPECIES: RNA polymerase sigma factor [unclassified Mesorhizobium]TGS96415.1 RNA polymerase sigma factor [bacterium M00.F.Ca.ET.177.01.1.1]TGQ52045.1 RNA polymerase sigma factor [Mesorhizobium sp. M1C.F.Ca.ET.210.01.1.1]TGQ68690.1 RNA polymerase sigma factor [Mesorhizobium sp. M1C.F.Ca.ET.212.01.1.1]TGR04146.1 RNA polymerase sigma factor [Mesorhizobium sp. M1C.F.Ca.ET.204.01.1.1]TGR24810.1 RNA polymerase sigma factor [Mesorhizobium sp. M1C.F.Ca.ET.196.01.1.1]
MRKPALQAAAIAAADDGDMALVRRALAREAGAFRAIIKTHNQRLYRIARGVVRNDAEAEDIVQEAYMRAFANLEAFRGDASLATWLSRIVINEALGRLRKKKRIVAMPENPKARIIRFPLNPSDLNSSDLNPGDDPERTMAQRQILALVERATDSLPDVYRTVFVARVIEGLSIEETADLLGIRPETVKTRLHRARTLVRKALDDEIGPVLLDAFPFAGRRCERLTQAVMRRLGFEG